MDETLFCIMDPDGRYTLPQISALIMLAEDQGHPVAAGSYLQDMTVRQLDNLLHGRTDA